MTISRAHIEINKIIGRQKSDFGNEVTCAQRGIVGFICHPKAMHLANTLASVSYSKKFAAGRDYLRVINYAMLLSIAKYL